MELPLNVLNVSQRTSLASMHPPSSSSVEGTRFRQLEWEEVDEDGASEDAPLRETYHIPVRKEPQQLPSANKIPRKPVPSATDAEEASLSDETCNRRKLDFSAPRQTTVSSRGSRSRFVRDWWLEFLCCFLVIGSFLSIVAVIYSHQGRPLPDWPYSITINSLVAIFVVMMKAAMILIVAEGLSQLKWSWFTSTRPLQDLATYDHASRGPWGAVELLFAVRGKNLTTSIGAFLMIAALATDPFAQQLVKFYDCSIPLRGTAATLPRTQIYFDDGVHIVAGQSTVSNGLQSAINAGIFTPGQIGIPFNCPTGNCTFPEKYYTLGYCSICTDISNRVTVQNITSYQNEVEINGTTDQPVPYRQYYNNLTYSLASGLSAFSSQLTGSFTYLTMGLNNNNSAIETIYVKPSAYGQEDICTTYGADSWQCRGYGAASCNMSFCIRTYAGVVKGGNLTEVLLSSTQVEYWGFTGSDWLSIVDLHCLTNAQRTALRNAGYRFNGDDQWLAYSVSISPDDGTIYTDPFKNISKSERHVVPLRCIYECSLLSVNNIDSFFREYFSGSILLAGAAGFDGPTNLQQIYNESFVNFETVQSALQNVSDSMTTFIRQNGYANYSDPTVGQVFHDETCVSVRWVWLTFPAALVVLMLLFLAAVIAETRQRQRGVHHDFKSSPLALMFHGFDLDLQDQLGSVGTSNEVREMSADAKRLFVRLSPTEKGLKFVSAC